MAQVTGGHASAVNSVAWALAASSASEADAPCNQTYACEHQMLSTSFDAAMYIHDIRQPDVPLLGLTGHTFLPKGKSMHQAVFSWGMILLLVPVGCLCGWLLALIDLSKQESHYLENARPLALALHSYVRCISLRSDHTFRSA